MNISLSINENRKAKLEYKQNETRIIYLINKLDNIQIGENSLIY